MLGGWSDKQVAQEHTDLVNGLRGSIESSLKKVHQLTGQALYCQSTVVALTELNAGFTDPVYAEAYIAIHGFDIHLGQQSPVFRDSVLKLSTDVLLVNQTAETMQNLCLDFSTLGDLKLVERPNVHTVAPHGFLTAKATIRVRPENVNMLRMLSKVTLGIVDRNRRNFREYSLGGYRFIGSLRHPQ